MSGGDDNRFDLFVPLPVSTSPKTDDDDDDGAYRSATIRGGAIIVTHVIAVFAGETAEMTRARRRQGRTGPLKLPVARRPPDIPTRKAARTATVAFLPDTCTPGQHITHHDRGTRIPGQTDEPRRYRQQ